MFCKYYDVFKTSFPIKNHTWPLKVAFFGTIDPLYVEVPPISHNTQSGLRHFISVGLNCSLGHERAVRGRVSSTRASRIWREGRSGRLGDNWKRREAAQKLTHVRRAAVILELASSIHAVVGVLE